MSSILTALFLGILQGLTEFLPVSSSGHLVLAQALLPNLSQPGVVFEVTLHIGTLRRRLPLFLERSVGDGISGIFPSRLESGK